MTKWKKCNWFPKGQRHPKLQSGPSRVWGPGLSPDHFGCPRIWPERNPTRGLARLKIQNISGWTFKEPRQHGPILIDFWHHFSFDLGKLDQIILWLFAKLLRSIVYMLYLSIRHDETMTHTVAWQLGRPINMLGGAFSVCACQNAKDGSVSPSNVSPKVLSP